MIKGLRRWFGLKTSEEDLLDLMVVAQEDAEVRDQLILILRQDDFTRQSMLNTWINELKLEAAPSSLIRALTSLVDNDRAHRALSILTTGSERAHQSGRPEPESRSV